MGKAFEKQTKTIEDQGKRQFDVLKSLKPKEVRPEEIKPVKYGDYFLKVGLSPSKKICVICLIESPLKMMKNAFYFVLKALFVLKVFKFMSRRFVHVGKTTLLER